MNKLMDYKRTYIGTDGEEYIYMGIPAFDKTKLKANSIKKLDQDYNGRIDTFTFYNVIENVDDIDLVMYINHIYNPFAVKDGEILYTPISEDLYHSTDEPELVDGSRHSDSQTATKKRSYAETVEYLAKLGYGIK